MTDTKVSQMTNAYAKEFFYWVETANTFFDLAKKRINDALEGGLDEAAINEEVSEAWLKCMAAQWTLFKSGRQTAIRMGLKRGIDKRHPHPAQDRKRKADEEVAKMLEKK